MTKAKNITPTKNATSLKTPPRCSTRNNPPDIYEERLAKRLDDRENNNRATRTFGELFPAPRPQATLDRRNNIRSTANSENNNDNIFVQIRLNMLRHRAQSQENDTEQDSTNSEQATTSSFSH